LAVDKREYMNYKKRCQQENFALGEII